MESALYVNGTKIPRVNDSEMHFLNRLTILYGPSGSGKSSLITHIINTIKDDVPVAVVCCPTNAMNGDYNGVFPESVIHDDMSKELLTNIFERQQSMIHMYSKVRDIDSLRSIFVKTASMDELDRVRKLDKILRDGTNLAMNQFSKEDAEVEIQELTDTYTRKVRRTMRESIKSNLNALSSRSDLTDDQRLIITNFKINPNMLLIIDDCAASIKEWRDLTETKKLFFQGRHYKITVLLTMQNEIIIPPPLRQNAHISIFATEKIANTFFNKASSGATNEDKKKISSISAAVFAPSDNPNRPNYKKLVVFGSIIKTSYRYQFMIANPRKYKFGSEPFWQLCTQAKKDSDGSGASSSKFNRMFNVKPQPILNC
jgi:energy-coupling factor transporter ATP-binding protein EcfA2